MSKWAHSGEFRRISRYALAGACNTIVAYVTFAILIFTGVHYAVATLFGGLAGMITSYFLSARWVFRYEGGRSRYWRFLTLFCGLYLMSVSIQKLILSSALLDSYKGGALATMATAIVGYLASRSWVFAGQAETRSDAAVPFR